MKHDNSSADNKHKRPITTTPASTAFDKAKKVAIDDQGGIDKELEEAFPSIFNRTWVSSKGEPAEVAEVFNMKDLIDEEIIGSAVLRILDEPSLAMAALQLHRGITIQVARTAQGEESILITILKKGAQDNACDD